MRLCVYALSEYKNAARAWLVKTSRLHSEGVVMTILRFYEFTKKNNTRSDMTQKI